VLTANVIGVQLVFYLELVEVKRLYFALQGKLRC
jgi:hypothetical protein